MLGTLGGVSHRNHAYRVRADKFLRQQAGVLD